MNDIKEISIVIPAYNEEKRLPSSIDSVFQYFYSMDEQKDFEVIVVDDGSSDGTGKVVADCQEKFKELVYIRNDVNMGKSATVARGFYEAKGKFVFFSDADFSTPVEYVKEAVALLRSNDADVVIASRRAPGAKIIDYPLYRRVMARGFNFIVRLLLLPGIRDTQCGFKAVRKDCVNMLFDRLYIKSLAFDVEVLYKARCRALKITELPVVWTNNKSSKVHVIKDSWKMFRDVCWMRLNSKKFYKR